MYVVKKRGKFLCHKGHYSKAPYLSDDLQDARIFKSVGACKASRLHIQEYSPEYSDWLAIPWQDKRGVRRPTKVYGDLKKGYEIIEVHLHVA